MHVVMFKVMTDTINTFKNTLLLDSLQWPVLLVPLKLIYSILHGDKNIIKQCSIRLGAVNIGYNKSEVDGIWLNSTNAKMEDLSVHSKYTIAVAYMWTYQESAHLQDVPGDVTLTEQGGQTLLHHNWKCKSSEDPAT